MAAVSEPERNGRRFVLVRTLGEGTFGCVYLADMEGAGGFRRRVALKLLNSSWDPSSDAGRRLRDEARLLGRLQHRHIVRVDDLVRLNGKWALVMEYVGGADLETLFERARERGQSLPPRAVAEMGVAVASALDAAWNAVGDDDQPLHVVHRDIKPSNVRLGEDGQVKVLDFGVARAEFAGREAKTERVRYGSLGYMAPERLLGDAETAAGDVYALAVMIWELIVGATYGRAELGPDQQAAQVRRAREALLAVVDHAPLADLLDRALAYEPEDRPTSAEMEVALRRLARDLPGDDIVTVARAFVIATRGGETKDPVEGQVMVDDSTSAPRVTGEGALVNSATISLPVGFDDEPLPPPRAPTGPDSLVEAPAPPARSPIATIAAVAGIGIALVVAGVVAWRLTSPPQPAAPAPVVAPVTVEAAPVQPAPIQPVPVEPAPAAPAEPPPIAAAAPAPVATAAAPATPSRPRAVAAPAPSAAPAPAPAATPAPSGPLLRAAKFTVTGADGIEVNCGGVTSAGATSAVVRDFPAGACAVRAGGLATSVTVDAPRGVACAVEGGSLTCR